MNPNCSRKLAIPSRLRGLSLIELMVALVLGLIIVAALSQLFVNISRTNQEMAKTNSQIENARFAMQFLQDDIAHAGFWDTYVPQFDDISLVEDPEDVPTAIPDPCRLYEEWNEKGTDPDYDVYREELLGIPLQVESAAPGTCGALMVDQVPDTDVMVVRHANTCEAGVGNCEDTGVATQLYFQDRLCNDDPDPDLFKLEPVSPMLDRTCTAGVFAPRRRFVQSIYYIRSWANVVGDGIPTLVRSQFDWVVGALAPAQQEAVALVEGIEAFRIEVGIDSLSEPHAGFPSGKAVAPDDPIEWLDEENWEIPTNRGDGIPDGDFVHCPTAGCLETDLIHVVAAKVYILARANEATPGYTDIKTYTMGEADPIGPFNDGFKRHVFSTTVRLNNVSARRETP